MNQRQSLSWTNCSCGGYRLESQSWDFAGERSKCCSSLLHFLPVHKILHLCSLRLRESCGLSIRKLSSLSLSPTAPSIRDSGKLPVFLFFFFEMVVMCREAFVAEEETIEEGEWEKER